MRGRARQTGQAAVEALAVVPLLVAAVLIGWQLVVIVTGALTSQEAVRAKAIDATGSGVVTVVHRQKIPSVIPGVRGLELRSRATVRTP